PVRVCHVGASLFRGWLVQNAVLTLEKVLATRRSPWELALPGYAHARAGARTAALEIIAELERMKTAFVSALCFALVYAGLNELDQASHGLRRLVRRGPIVWPTSRWNHCG